MKQDPHIVLGGEIVDVNGDDVEFADLTKVDLVGIYPSYEAALPVWRGKAQFTVDNAHMRYFVLPVRKLLEPKHGVG